MDLFDANATNERTVYTFILIDIDFAERVFIANAFQNVNAFQPNEYKHQRQYTSRWFRRLNIGN